MPRLRTPPDDRVEVAIEELVTLASSVHGMDIEPDHDGWVTVTVGAASWRAPVIACDAVSRRSARQLMASEGVDRVTDGIWAPVLTAEAT